MDSLANELEELQEQRCALWRIEDRRALTRDEEEDLQEISLMIHHLAEEESAWADAHCPPDGFDPSYAGENWSEDS